MAEIYIGDQQISGGGSGGGGTIDTSGFVDVSTWDEHEKVIASALVDLKSLESKIEDFDESIQNQTTALLAEVHVVEQQKADASVVYTKTEIDKSDKVVAAALAELNDRVSTLESSSGGGSGSGETFDPSYLEEDLLDVSSRVEVFGNLTLDVSARVDALEQIDYVETNDISAFVTQTAFDSSYVSLDISVKALDASALAFDASIKELASSGGGGDSDPAFVKYTNTSDSTKVGIVSSLRTAAPCTSIGLGAVILGNGIASGQNSISFGGIASGQNSISFGGTASGQLSFSVLGKASSHSAISMGNGSNASKQDSTALGYGATAKLKQQTAICGKSIVIDAMSGSGADAVDNAVCIGLNNSKANTWGSFAIGHSIITGSYYEMAVGKSNKTHNSSTSFGQHGNNLFDIGNGVSNSSTHNAFEVRQSGDIYIPDVSASGEYYEKPMINLQQKIYELEARIVVLESAVQTQ